MKIELTPAALKTIHEHAERDYPNECCGFLYGEESEVRRITLARPVGNSKEGDQRRRFQIDPNDYRKAELYAAEHDLDLLGVYHSHPDHPAEPSEHDLKQALPFFSYIIVSVREGESDTTTSWRLDDEGQFEEEIITQRSLVQQP